MPQTADELRAVAEEQISNMEQDDTTDEPQDNPMDGIDDTPDNKKPEDGGGNDDAGDDAGDDKGGKESDDKGKEGGDDEDKIEPIDVFQGEDDEEEDGKGKKKVEPEGDEEEEDGLNPEDAKLIDKRVQKQLKPYESRIQEAAKQERDSLFNAFIAGEGKVFEPYANDIRALIHDPRFQSMGIKKDVQIAVAVAMKLGWKGLLKIGAEREREATAKAKSTKTGGSGSSTRGSTDTSGVPDASKLSPEQFGKLKQKIASGKSYKF